MPVNCLHAKTGRKGKVTVMNYRLMIGWFVLAGLLCGHVFFTVEAKGNLKVIYAINAGSHEHTDQNGITYDADPLRIGTASDYGNHLIMIGRVPEQDEILYRTERYHTATFGYDLPLNGDGEYALILKFCEVYFTEPNKKVFDVVLNRQHKIVSKLDIYHQVGRGTAHEEYVYFKVAKGKLLYKDEESNVVENMIRLDFVKGSYDNPKINAFVLLKGDVERIPRLLPLSDEQDEQIIPSQDEHQRNRIASEMDYESKSETKVEESINEEVEPSQQRTRTLSGPRKPNPYMDEDSSSLMLPICIAIGAFIPLLFCLCKL